jgi:signal transduction histidine kinase
MNTGSLRLRLILAASVAISLALALAGLVFYYQFQKHVERLMILEFNGHFEQLATFLVFDKNQNLVVDGELSDPRFSKQLGGLYWQIDIPGATPLRSRSLWDESLQVPTPPQTNEDEHIHELPGPNDTTLLALERLVNIEKPDGTALRLVATIGIDNTSVSNALTGFSNEIKSGLGLLYIALLASSIAQIMIGLKPLESIRKGLESIRAGTKPRMDGVYPKEVQPLVAELNTLIEAREQQLGRARQRAGNLAHGLKTPLTVLDAIASEIRDDGHGKASTEIREATHDMRVLIDRELTRARTSADSPRLASRIHPTVTRLVKALQHARDGEPLSWQIDIQPDDTLPMDAGDAMELLGNLIDNAQKHATHRVRVAIIGTTLSIEDDGPGVDPSKYASIIKRGVKLDERKSGSGLGLAIVQELVDAYGATLTLDRSNLGGLSVQVKFKAA